MARRARRRTGAAAMRARPVRRDSAGGSGAPRYGQARRARRDPRSPQYARRTGARVQLQFLRCPASVPHAIRSPIRRFDIAWPAVQGQGSSRMRARAGMGCIARFLVVILSLCDASAAMAQDWPARPVRIVNTFAAGGTADVLARMVADHLSGAFGQQFFVETRAGAGGAIGVQSVVNSPPDGYNLVITNVSLLVLAPATNPKLGFHPLNDLTNIAYIAGAPIVLAVNAAGGLSTLADFIAAARQGDKPMTYSSSGVGSMGHLVAEAFAQKAGIRIEHVPYKGASQGLLDL